MRLDEYLETLPSWQRDNFNRKLNFLIRPDSLMMQFGHNIRLECRLDEWAWRRLVAAVRAAPDTPEKLKESVSKAFQKFPWKGGTIPSPWPTRLGRAVDRSAFITWLSKNPNVTAVDASQFLDDIADEPVQDARYAFGAVEFSQYPMWATFNDSAPDSNPFVTMLPPVANGIRVRLGLPMNKAEELVLMVYSLPAGTIPHCPTVANAYASPSWTAYFRPSHPSEPFGWTQPHEEPLGTTAEPCPEIVHRPVSSDCLEEPLRIARP